MPVAHWACKALVLHTEEVKKAPPTAQLSMMNFVNVKANRGRRKNAGAGGARANAGRKKAAESAGDALAVINQPATPTVAKKIKCKRMNFDSPDNQELMNEAIQGFRNKRGRFWQPGLSARSYPDYVFQERSKSCQECGAVKDMHKKAPQAKRPRKQTVAMRANLFGAGGNCGCGVLCRSQRRQQDPKSGNVRIACWRAEVEPRRRYRSGREPNAAGVGWSCREKEL